MPPRRPANNKAIETLRHDAATRRNIPTAEMESFFRREEDAAPLPPVSYPRARPLPPGMTRTAEEPSVPEIVWNGARITITDEQAAELARTGTLTLSDAQLVWRGKDRQDWSDLIVNVPPIYIQEKIHPKVIIDDLKRRSDEAREAMSDAPDLFADFNGVPADARAEFYSHDQHWSNRMILGDSLAVMASLAERESLKGKVQCIYFDPPYGIKFNSNWQVSTQNRDVKDGKQADISREPEQVKAFRDTWKDGIHSYLTYLRDRFTVIRELLNESGSIFVQIGDENIHRVRAVLDEVFGSDNFVNQVDFVTTGGQSSLGLGRVFDHIVWYARDRNKVKFRQPYSIRELRSGGGWAHSRIRLADGTRQNLGKDEVRRLLETGAEIDPYYQDNLSSQGTTAEGSKPFQFQGRKFYPPANSHWKTRIEGMERLAKAQRIDESVNSIRYVRLMSDFSIEPINNVWDDTIRAGYIDQKRYIVETIPKVIERCILMTTDPGDLVLDPTCGSGTTAYVAEQWGRRWITIDTSRVALALARTRLMAARYPWYLLADSKEGRAKEAELTRRPPPELPVRGDIRQGFVYERVPHITLKSIANNPEIDEIWERWQPTLHSTLEALNYATGEQWEEWQVPGQLTDGRETRLMKIAPETLGLAIADLPLAEQGWVSENHMLVGTALAHWWRGRIARQREIDASIAARADVEYLYDKPYTDNGRVRVAGPFTVESLSPHRVLPLDDELDGATGETQVDTGRVEPVSHDFAAIVIDYLRSEGVKQQAKDDRITFESIEPWPGQYVGATATFHEGEGGLERRAAILIGPEYGTVGRQDLVAAAREAVDARFDLLIACAFNFDAHSAELSNLGPLRILKARINPDMHMSDELKNTGRGNMFVVFGEPDVDLLDDGGPEIRVKVNGVDVFDPNTGDIRSGDTSSIAAWFVDTDYNEESFFVRHAYFLGANDPYKSLKTALQAEIDADAWSTLYSDVSRPFARPASGRIAVKVINHFGDEVMKVFRV